MPCSVIIVEDHPVSRHGVRTVIESMDGFQVVGETHEGRAAIALVREHSPDLVILDMWLPDLDGSQVARILQERAPATRILVLSVNTDLETVTEMLAVGASGYVDKMISCDELKRAIRTVMDGNIFVSPRINTSIIHEYTKLRQMHTDQAADPLAPREREVLSLIAEGLLNKEIAHRLSLSTRTIESLRAQIMDKLELRTTAALTKYAIKKGLTSL